MQRRAAAIAPRVHDPCVLPSLQSVLLTARLSERALFCADLNKHLPGGLFKDSPMPERTMKA